MNGLVDKLFEASTAGGNSSLTWDEFVALHALVERVREAQAGKSIHAQVAGHNNPAALLAWFREHGGTLNEKLSVEEIPGFGKGIKTSQHLAEDEGLVEVPEKLMMTQITAAKSALAPLIDKDDLLQRMPSVLLSMHLLFEAHNKSSFWGPYISELPATHSTPAYWQPADIALLRGTTILNETLASFKVLCRQYAYLHRRLRAVPKLLSADKFTFDDFRWAVATVMSRQNQIPVGGTDEAPVFSLALIPVWDLFNHRPGKMTTFHDCAVRRTRCTAMAPFRAGEQVFSHYGQRSMGDMLLYMGCLTPAHVLINIGLARADRLFEFKAKTLARLQMRHNDDFEVGNGSVEPALFVFARVATATNEELEAFAALDDAALRAEFSKVPSASADPPAPGALVTLDARAYQFLFMRFRLLTTQPPPALETATNAFQRLALGYRHAEHSALLSCLATPHVQVGKS
eukprot:m.63080 g.63080  ORF g.63080 m.63080 type:complete len:459 (-) comp12448_c0_seq1:21-1397(-)